MLGKRDRASGSASEFLLDIQHRSLWEAMNAKHQAGITRARRAGVVVRRATEPTAIEQRVGLMTQSLLRHKSQGEDVDLHGDTAAIRALVKHECGGVFQAVYDDRVLASADHSPRRAWRVLPHRGEPSRWARACARRTHRCTRLTALAAEG